jgi:hypothetical protein
MLRRPSHGGDGPAPNPAMGCVSAEAMASACIQSKDDGGAIEGEQIHADPFMSIG